jgi:hypothetical protein
MAWTACKGPQLSLRCFSCSPCSSNAFALLIFGRTVEEEEGAFGLWLTYLVAGVGGTVASYLTSPHSHTISLGASGAVHEALNSGASCDLVTRAL